MNSARVSLREIFADAAEIAEPAARAGFLDRACGEDGGLRQRVERLLAADARAGKFLRQSGDTTTGELIAEKPGDRIGRYRLVECIGRGGGGVVYLAEQEEPVRRRVALKILKLGMDTQSVVARFEAERQALAMMEHPNIARVLDAGATETGRPYFIMELVAGKKLTDYCKRHQLSLRQRLELFIPVCQAVQHAHQKGIIHRDLKPSNILVTEHEGVAVPKVIDFGIAKAIEQAPEEQGGLTSVNVFLGTPAYMSPEQVEFGGRDIDTRADIYSLGVILYELLTGQPPFDPKQLARSSLEEMRRIIREVDPPRPSTTITRNLNPGRVPMAGRARPTREALAAVRGDLDWVVMKCLEKDRGRRYETANGLATDIRRHLNNEAVVARPPSQLYKVQKVVRRHRIIVGAAAAVGLVLVSAVIVSTQLAWRARRAEREETRLRTVAEAKADESRQHLVRRYVAEGNRLLEEGRPVNALPWMVEALALESGDPQREADERLRIAQAALGAPELRLHLAQGKRTASVALSPDGGLLASGSEDGQVRISDLAGGRPGLTNLSLPGGIGRLRFSPDNTRLVAVDMAGRARLWDAITGGALSPLLQAGDCDERSVANVAQRLRPAASFSPDGKLLLLAWASKSAQLRDAADGKLVREFSHQATVYHAAFSPGGQEVVTSGKDGTARVWETATGKPAGPPLEPGGWIASAQFSPDGGSLLTVRELHRVQVWDWRDGRRLAPEIPRRSTLCFASFSPNGSNILTAAWSSYVLVYDAATSRQVEQFEHPGGVVDAAFMPDNRHFAAACDDGNVWIWALGASSRRPLVLPEGNHIEQIEFSRNGQELAVGTLGGHARVWALSPPERGVRRLPGSDVAWVNFDRSGQHALLVSTGAKSGVGVYETQTGKLVSFARMSFGSQPRARFSPNGRRILAFSTRPGATVLEVHSGKQSFPALPSHGAMREALWSPDGKAILTAAASSGVQAWDAATGKLIRDMPETRGVTALALGSDGTKLAVAQTDRRAVILDMLTGLPLRELKTDLENVQQIQFSPDGRRVAMAGEQDTDGIVQVNDLATGELVGRPLAHRDLVRYFEFSPDGRCLATACDDHSVRVWNAETGEPISPWLPHPFEARSAHFSPDGARLVTLARRGAVRLWNSRTGEPITVPLLYRRNTGDGDVCYSPDGQSILLCRGGNEAWLRDLRPEPARLEELKLRAQVASCTRFDPAAGMVPLEEEALNRAWERLRALQAGR